MDYTVLGTVLGAIFFISGGLFTLYKFTTTIRKEREDENEKILQSAKDYVDSRCDVIQTELSHQKDLHEGKITELSQKIEELREEMRRHHTQLVELLSKMLDKNI